MVIHRHRKKVCLTYSKCEIKTFGESVLEHTHRVGDFENTYPSVSPKEQTMVKIPS